MTPRAGWTLVAAGAIGWAAVLWPLHDLLPMWVEGLPHYVDQLLGVLRRACTPPQFVVEFAGRSFPLGIDAYQGSLMTYLDVPVARLWLGALIDDPYAYRYKGIVLLALAGALLYPLLLRVAPPAPAALGALLLVTLPLTSVIAIGDLQYHTVLLVAVPALLLPLVRFAESGHRRWLVLAALIAGASLSTRAEVLVWTSAALAAWVLLDRRALLRQAWNALTPGLVAAALTAFAIGAAPTIAMNFLAPDQSLVRFLLGGATIEPDAARLASLLPVRLYQFVHFVLLSGFGLYRVQATHAAFLVLALVSLAAALRFAWRERRWPLALVALLVVLPLSVVANRGPRDIHLLPLVIPVVALITEFAGRLPRRWGAGLLVAAIATNVFVGQRVLDEWARLRAVGSDTVATHACPECLTQALARHPGSRVFHTNLGSYGEALWFSRAHACGYDLHRAHGAAYDDAILNAVEHAGTNVFVAIPPDREPMLVREGRAYPRTQRLLELLARHGTAASGEPVHDTRGHELYRLYVVHGPVLQPLALTGGGFNAAQDGRVTGWVLGQGFRRGDVVLLDGRSLSTTYGSDGLLTFVVDEATILRAGNPRIEVERGSRRSEPLLVQRR